MAGQPEDSLNGAAVAQAVRARAAQSQPSKLKCPLTLLQANLLVAMLGGFWARQADGHPGPDLMGRGLVILRVMVGWEAITKQRARKVPPAKQPRRKPT